jgi:hypothetical protein
VSEDEAISDIGGPSLTSSPFPVSNDYPFVLLVGASSNHFNSILFTMHKARQHIPSLPVLVWDYGMTSDQIQAVQGMWNTEYRYFNFSMYPPWMRLSAVAKGQYAWKITAIYESARQYRRVFWLDGDIDIICSFQQTLDHLKKQGWFGIGLRGSIPQWTHEGMFKYLKLNPQDYQNKSIAAGGINAFDFDHERGRRLLQRWYNCGSVLDCIGPKGSSRENHRQDQSALSLLIHDEGMEVLHGSESCFRPHAFIGKVKFEDIIEELSQAPILHSKMNQTAKDTA